MNFLSRALISLFILLFIFPQSKGTENAFKAEAERAFPNRDTLIPFTDLATVFHPMLHPDVKIKFDANFSIMYLPNFPAPKHHISVITKGFRCMYVDMKKAELLNDEEKKEDQLAALNRRLAFHIPSIAQFDAALAAEIAPFPCENCAATARASLGMGDAHPEYESPLKNDTPQSSK